MRILTDLEVGWVTGGQTGAAEIQEYTSFCAANPHGSISTTRKGREFKATVAGTGVTVGGGSTTVVVRCDGQGRTNGNDDDKKEKKE